MPYRVKLVGEDGRGVAVRKWLVDRSAGHLVFLAELTQKAMLKHHWPCEYAAPKHGRPQARLVHFFHPEKLHSPAWHYALQVLAHSVADAQGATIKLDGRALSLVGEYHWKADGRLGKGGKPPF